MFVYPLVRVNRAIVSSLIFANDPLTGIAISKDNGESFQRFSK